MAEASYLAAFLGGVLSLLSPCSALLLPAFFAYAFGERGELVKKTALFYVGLATTLVPLGAGIAAVSSLFYGHRSALITASGAVLISLGVVQAFGGGFSFGLLERLRGKIRGRSAVSVLALGAVYGFAGFCAGPVLGAILTVAAASGGTVRGASLLAVYALGMALPLFLMALLWDRLDLGRRRWLRGREVGVSALRFHTSNLLSGAMFVALGTAFVVYEGGAALSGLYESRGATDLAFATQTWATSLPQGIFYGIALVAAMVVTVAAIRRRHYRSRRDPADHKEGGRAWIS